MRENLWNNPGIPHKGYTWLGVRDLEDAVGECEMCGNKPLRYVHEVSHFLLDETMWVGSDCAAKMCGDDAPVEREKAFINREKRRRNFLKKEWKDDDFFDFMMRELRYRRCFLEIWKRPEEKFHTVLVRRVGSPRFEKQGKAEGLLEAQNLAFDLVEQLKEETES